MLLIDMLPSHSFEVAKNLARSRMWDSGSLNVGGNTSISFTFSFLVRLSNVAIVYSRLINHNLGTVFIRLLCFFFLRYGCKKYCLSQNLHVQSFCFSAASIFFHTFLDIRVNKTVHTKEPYRYVELILFNERAANI